MSGLGSMAGDYPTAKHVSRAEAQRALLVARSEHVAAGPDQDATDRGRLLSAIGTGRHSKHIRLGGWAATAS
jgi:hypothetical protein